MRGLREIEIRGAAVLIAFTLAMTLTYAVRFYLDRQGYFNDAAFFGQFSRMKLLYSLGVDVNATACPYSNCYTPLWAAADGGYDDAVLFLLDRGADVNGRSNLDMTPLMVAAFYRRESTVRLLLSRGADVNAERDDGETALTLARDRGHRRIVELLRSAGARETR